MSSVGSTSTSDYVFQQLNAPNQQKAEVIKPEDYAAYAKSKYAAMGYNVSDAYIDYEINFPLNNPQGGAQLLPDEWERQFGQHNPSKTAAAQFTTAPSRDFLLDALQASLVKTISFNLQETVVSEQAINFGEKLKHTYQAN